MRLSTLLCAGFALTSVAVADSPTLSLRPVSNEPVMPGSTVAIAVSMSGLGEMEAAGFQAFIEFNPARLQFISGTYTSSPFGLPILNPIQAKGDSIDLAAGINTFVGQLPSSKDADLAILLFKAVEGGCIVSVMFRDHEPPTRLTDAEGQPIEPLQLVSLPAGPPTPDLNGDGAVDVQDLLILLAAWGPCPEEGACPADLNCDGIVDVLDLLNLLANWGPIR